MNELTRSWTLSSGKCSKKEKGAAWRGCLIASQKADLPLKRGVPGERSKKIKKIIDDLAAILSLTKTSADASRYRCTVMAAGLTNRQSRLLQMERSGWPSHKKP
jgi:hypothetical protein